MCGWNAMNLNQQQGDGIGEQFNLRQFNLKLIIWFRAIKITKQDNMLMYVIDQ